MSDHIQPNRESSQFPHHFPSGNSACHVAHGRTEDCSSIPSFANLNGGDGNDTLTGGAVRDDVVLSGVGLDILDGGDCDDTEIQD